MLLLPFPFDPGKQFSPQQVQPRKFLLSHGKYELSLSLGVNHLVDDTRLNTATA